MPNDLTFQQLADNAPADAVQVSDGTTALSSGVYINVSNLTGDSIQALSDAGVVETMIKAVRAAQAAQTSVNANVSPGQQLNAFPPSSFGTPTQDANTGQFFAQITAAVTGRAPLSVDDTVGPTI